MKKHFILFCIYTTVVFGLCSCGAAPNFSADQEQQMESVITGTMSTYGIPGVVAGVWIPGKGTWVKAFGQANTDTGEAINENTLFKIGSLTKPFTATVILKLSEEGKVNLDSPLDKYITDPVIPNAHNITVRQLASMTSGLFNYTEDMTFLLAIRDDPTRVWAPKELINYAIAHSPYFAPGTSYYYSNTNFVLLGMIIEKVTGNSLGSEIQKRVISPLGLSNTSFATYTTMPSGSCHGYGLADDAITIVDSTVLSPSVSWAAGANISNLYDIKKMAEAVGNGTLLSDASHNAQFTFGNEPGSTIERYGLGVMNIGKFVGHEGIINGFNSIMMYLPDNGAVIVIMDNMNPTLNGAVAKEMFFKISKIALPNEVSW